MRAVLPLVSLSLVCPVIGNAGRSLSEEDTAKIKRVHSKYEEACQGRCRWRALSLHGGLCVAAATRRQAAYRAKGIERILVFARCSANSDHQAGRDTAEYRCRRGDRVCVGDGRSGLDDGAKRQDDERVAQRNVLECSAQANEWGVEDVAPYVG